jgi:tripartite-type tricarboxylate transporter receptor subunit TctC
MNRSSTGEADERHGAAPRRSHGRREMTASLLALGLALALPGPARSQPASPDFPTRPVRMIVPYPPGGSVDPVARLVSQKLTEMWKQQVIVDNRPGASTIIGTEAVAKAAPDGYTLLITASTHVSNALLFSNLPYDSVKDFAPVATLYKAEFVLVENPSVPANTLKEFIALAKSKPGQISYASAGPGNANHMAGELFSRMTGVQLLHVPYKGGGPLTNDLLSGQVQLYFAVPAAVLQHIQAGKLKALATTAETRLPLMPNVPTFAEAGLPGFGMRSWIGVLAPAATPPAVVEKISADIARILAMPDVKEKLESQGQIPFTMTPAQMATMMRDDSAEFARIIKAANIKIEQ